MLSAAGAPTLRGVEARVFELLAESGILVAGAVIVGSHAFAAYQQMLGVRWPTSSTKTMDVDLTASEELKVAVPNTQFNLKETLLASDLGFFEVPMLNHKAPSTSFSIKGRQLKVDLVTPLVGKPSGEPIALETLGSWASPVRFLDFLLDNTQPVVLLTPSGVLAQVPEPARFAVHKLVLSQRRPAAKSLKAKKDLQQAELLLQVLIEYRPADIKNALAAANLQVDKFIDQLQTGMQKLSPHIIEALSDLP